LYGLLFVDLDNDHRYKIALLICSSGMDVTPCEQSIYAIYGQAEAGLWATN
jgi:hypothetical protein